MTTALDVRDLTIRFGNRPPVVSGVDLHLDLGERVGLIGESGSGKSVTALAMMGLLPEYAHVTGDITLAGLPMIGRTERQLAKIRGNELGMVFQEPMTALDPTMRVGRQLLEVITLHRDVSRAAGRQEVRDMLVRVGLDEPDRVTRSFPHQLSGGQRQRVVLAMALMNSPALLICDEPTTALDVTVQARVLRVLDEVLTAEGAACLFISHDLAVVAQVCSRVAVMLDGQIVETGPVDQIFNEPQHRYTQGLVATSRLDRVEPGTRLPVVADFWQREEPT